MTEECPRCSSEHTIRYGKRTLETGAHKQIYYCNQCGHKYTEQGFKNKRYPGKVIVEALKLFSTGYSLEETSRKINKRFKVKTGKSTIHNWVEEYRENCKILEDREEYLNGYQPEELIQKHIYYHQKVKHSLKYHCGKLDKAEKQGHTRITKFIKELENETQKKRLQKNRKEGGKPVQKQLSETQNLESCKKKNNVCKLAEYALKADKKNNSKKKILENIQDLTLKTDKATVATDVPVWYYDKKLEDTVASNIDIVQIRKGKTHILEYKPRAEEVEPVNQLRTLVKGLSRRTGISQEDFKAAWFNEDIYKEM